MCSPSASEQQILSRTLAAAPPASTAAPASAAAAAGAGSAPVATPAPSPAEPVGSGAGTGEGGLLSQLVSLLQKPKPAQQVDLATSDDEGEALDERVGAFFTTPHSHWEVSERFAMCLSVVGRWQCMLRAVPYISVSRAVAFGNKQSPPPGWFFPPRSRLFSPPAFVTC